MLRFIITRIYHYNCGGRQTSWSRLIMDKDERRTFPFSGYRQEIEARISRGPTKSHVFTVARFYAGLIACVRFVNYQRLVARA